MRNHAEQGFTFALAWMSREFGHLTSGRASAPYLASVTAIGNEVLGSSM